MQYSELNKKEPSEKVKAIRKAGNYKKYYTGLKKQIRLEMEESRAERVGRNSPCPCGSGKKFKKCCIK